MDTEEVEIYVFTFADDGHKSSSFVTNYFKPMLSQFEEDGEESGQVAVEQCKVDVFIVRDKVLVTYSTQECSEEEQEVNVIGFTYLLKEEKVFFGYFFADGFDTLVERLETIDVGAGGCIDFEFHESIV